MAYPGMGAAIQPGPGLAYPQAGQSQGVYRSIGVGRASLPRWNKGAPALWQ